MDRDVIIGVLLILIALGFMTYVVFWSRRIIEHIRRKKLHSARSIIKEMNGKK